MWIEREVKLGEGQSLRIVIPAVVVKFLNVEDGDILIIEDGKGDHGNQITIWKKNLLVGNDDQGLLR